MGSVDLGLVCEIYGICWLRCRVCDLWDLLAWVWDMRLIKVKSASAPYTEHLEDHPVAIY